VLIYIFLNIFKAHVSKFDHRHALVWVLLGLTHTPIVTHSSSLAVNRLTSPLDHFSWTLLNLKISLSI